MSAYDSYKNRELIIKKIERDLDDFGKQDPKVNQIRLIPENDAIDYIGWKPKEEKEIRKENNGFEDVTTETEPISVSDLSDKILEIASALQDSNRVSVNVSFTRWDQSKDDEQDGDEAYFFIQGSQFDDLHLVEPDEEEDQDDEKEEVF